MATSIDLRFQCEGFSETLFQVLRFSGEEGISRLYWYRIDLVTDQPDAVDIDTLQDQPSTFTIATSEHQRVIQGMVSHVETLDRADGGALFRVTLVPRVWELTRGTTNKVYLDTTTPDIIRQVLEQAGITEADYDLQLTGDYRNWAFRFQYGESYWDFLSRVLERDGIYYYFVAGEDTERICFCDSWREQPEIEDTQVPFTTALGFGPTDATRVVHSIAARHSRIQRTLTLQNYNDAQPSTRISSRIEVDPKGAGEVNIYGQKVLDQGEADALAEIRADELRWQKEQYHGESTVTRLRPAHYFELTGHPRYARNRSYQIVAIEHRGYDPKTAHLMDEGQAPSQSVYENTFTAIPGEVQYRPVRATEQPMITGTLNAQIDAEGPGEYAEIDEEGRYHVVFPFDTEHPSGRASHWVRLMQPYSGEREGMHFPLRKRARVLISFLAGDPDLPVISGAIPNAEQPSVTTADSPEKGALRTPGGNVVETDDTVTREWVKVRAPTPESRMQLGVDESSGTDSTEATGDPASSSEQSDDPDGSGIILETKGMVRFAHFAGSSEVAAASSWAISQTLWSDSLTYRDRELGATLDTLRDKGSQQGWRIKDAVKRVFPFPRKHDGDGTSGQVSTSEEASGSLLVSRTVGDEYSYRSGTSFHFAGYDREVFEFGPKYSYTVTDHNRAVEGKGSIRDTIRGGIQGVSAGGSNIADQYRKLFEARQALEAKHDQLAGREHELQALRGDADERATTCANDPAIDLPSPDALVFDSEEDLERWLTLANYDRQGSPEGAITRIAQWRNGAEGGEAGLTGYVVLPDQLASQGTTSPRSGSVEEARRERDQAQRDYDSQHAAYESDVEASEEPSGSVQARLRNGRIDYREGDLFLWHLGRVYDFGGAEEFVFGFGYVENHTGAYEEHTNEDGFNLEEGKSIFQHDREHDLIKTYNKKERKIEWDSRVYEPLRSQVKDPFLVEKTIGDTYDYHYGNSIEVHVGDSMTVDKEANQIELVYAGETLVRDFRKVGPTYQEWQYDLQGRNVLYEAVDYSVGWNAFTFSAALTNTMSIRTALSNSFDISTTGSSSMSIDLGLSRDIALSMAGGLSLSMAGALDLDMSFATGVAIGMDFSNGVNIGIERANAANINIDLTTSPPTLDLNAAAVKLYTQVGHRAISVTGIQIEQEQMNITVKTMGMNQAFQMNL